MIGCTLDDLGYIRMGRALVRINDAWKRCVAFLGRETDQGGVPDLRGTGFLVGHDGALYLITARHVARQIEGAPAYLCMNGVDGKAANFLVERIEWTHHPDERADVSAAAIRLDEALNFWPFPSEYLATDPTIAEKNIGPGDLAYIMGLFKFVPGRGAYKPVVHTGHVAMMPAEEIPVRGSLPLEGYLVEAKSPLDGLSGSPVFVRKTVAVKKAPGAVSGIEPKAYGAPWVLGVWVAGWDIEEAPSGAILPRGMGIVAPAYRIVELLNSERFMKDREKRRQERLETEGATLKSLASGKTAKESNPRHKEDFTHLLGAVARGKKLDGET